MWKPSLQFSLQKCRGFRSPCISHREQEPLEGQVNSSEQDAQCKGTKHPTHHLTVSMLLCLLRKKKLSQYNADWNQTTYSLRKSNREKRASLCLSCTWATLNCQLQGKKGANAVPVYHWHNTISLWTLPSPIPSSSQIFIQLPSYKIT